MTPKKKSCIKCAYLGEKGTEFSSMRSVVIPIPIRDGGKIPCIEDESRAGPIQLTCYHGFWDRATVTFAEYQEAVGKSERENPNDEIIYSTHSEVFNLSKHSCKYFTHFNTLGVQSLERLSERQQEEKQTRRYWVSIIISVIIAISALIITFFSGN